MINFSIHVSTAGFSVGYSNFKIELFYQTEMTLLNSLAMFSLHDYSVSYKHEMTAKTGKKQKLKTLSGLVSSCSPTSAADIQQASCEIHVSIFLPLVGNVDNTVPHSAQLSVSFV